MKRSAASRQSFMCGWKRPETVISVVSMTIPIDNPILYLKDLVALLQVTLRGHFKRFTNGNFLKAASQFDISWQRRYIEFSRTKSNGVGEIRVPLDPHNDMATANSAIYSILPKWILEIRQFSRNAKKSISQNCSARSRLRDHGSLGAEMLNHMQWINAMSVREPEVNTDFGMTTIWLLWDIGFPQSLWAALTVDTMYRFAISRVPVSSTFVTWFNGKTAENLNKRPLSINPTSQLFRIVFIGHSQFPIQKYFRTQLWIRDWFWGRNAPRTMAHN
jgi:hypothetical protein